MAARGRRLSRGASNTPLRVLSPGHPTPRVVVSPQLFAASRPARLARRRSSAEVRGPAAPEPAHPLFRRSPAMVGLEKLLIGRTLSGRYTVEELIGQGRGGLVYRARDSRSGVEVAVKVLNAPRSAEARERFRQLVGREVAAAATVRHPNVATVFEMGGDAERALDFVVTGLVRGQSLAGVLAQRGKPPIALGLRLLGDAAEGLGAGHAAGLVHRDLRPASLYMV